jgi:hypothetical protein
MTIFSSSSVIAQVCAASGTDDRLERTAHDIVGQVGPAVRVDAGGQAGRRRGAAPVADRFGIQQK